MTNPVANLYSREENFQSYNDGILALPDLLNSNINVEAGRVTNIVLNSQHPLFSQVGGFNGIGTIEFQKVNTKEDTSKNYAKPFFPQFSSFPLINEIVLIFQLPSQNQNIEKELQDAFYYLSAVSIWNHPHHNAYPSPENPGLLPEDQQRDYKEIENGYYRRTTDGDTDIKLNSPNNPSQNTFKELMNIHPLLPFSGDRIFEGRWGNSIRLAGTSNPKNNPDFKQKNYINLNNWSNFGGNGNPITIIRNGQPNEILNKEGKDITLEGWKPITEDINKDLSSIYLTSNQQIPIVASSVRYNSYTTKEKEVPQEPAIYNANQIILSSGRLLFNSSTDHILLSSQRTISFNAQKGFNFDTPSNFVIDAGTTIKFGSKSANESIVKGDTLYRDLNNVLDLLIDFVKLLETSQLFPGGAPVPNSAVNLGATTTSAALQIIQDNLHKIKSKKVKTI